MTHMTDQAWKWILLHAANQKWCG